MEHNPSDRTEMVVLDGALAVTSSTDVTSTTRIDLKGWRWFEIIVCSGALGSTILSIVPKLFAAASAGSPTATLATLTHGTDDSCSRQEHRCHGLDQFLEVDVDGAAGTGGDASFVVILHGPDDTREVAAYSGAKVQIGLT